MTDATRPEPDGLEVHRAPYEPIPRSALQDERLSYRARGVLAYMLSLPDGWAFAADRMAGKGDDPREGREAVRTALNELAALGYVRRRLVNGVGGRIGTLVEVAATPDMMPPLSPATGFRAPVSEASVSWASKREHIDETHTQATPLASLAPSAAPRKRTRADFEEWWEAYPRKVGKRTAEAAYYRAVKRMVPGDDPARVLLDGAKAYRDDPNREPEFTAHPTTWLNRNGWEDEALPARGVDARSTGARSQGILERSYSRHLEDEQADRRGIAP